MAKPSTRGGRPLLATDQRRSHAVSVYLTASEIRALRHRARQSGRAVATLIREDLARASTAGAQAGPDDAGAAALRRDIGRIGTNLNQAVKALHSARGRPDAGTLEAVRRAADAVAERIARWA